MHLLFYFALFSGNAMLKKLVPDLKSALSKFSKGKADILLTPGSRLEFGSRWIEALPTPGHTAGCMSYLLDDGSMVFTGDALLVRGCGRTDFQEGSSETLYDSIHNQLFCLPHETIVFPAHDYKVGCCILDDMFVHSFKNQSTVLAYPVVFVFHPLKS